MTELERLKSIGEAPKFYTEESYTTVSKGYLQEGETPKAMYRRVARSACKSGHYNDDIKHDLFYVMFHRNWLGPASPVLSNLGTDRGLPISCFGIDIDDRMEDIMGRGLGELAMLTKFGGGVGVSLNRLRPRGSLIKGGKNGKSEGIIPFAKVYDSAILASKQGEVRRGSAQIGADIEHMDYPEFIRMRRPEGDVNRQCLNLHHCANLSDEFMHKVKNGDMEARLKWTELMKTRIETGEPYMMFTDTVNRANPQSYSRNHLNVSMTNICSEIVLYTDPLHSFVCCLSSLNINEYDAWKDWKGKKSGLSLPELAIYFLNGVLDEFIEKAQYLPFMENTVRSAVKGRALGLGVMGWHSYLMEHMIPFESFRAMQLNNEIFKFINAEAIKASKTLAAERYEPEWCVGTDMYNTHLLALAPTKSNSIICGDVSPGIEPYTANAFTDVTGKGTFLRKSKYLVKLLEEKGENTDKVWKSISSNNGSVQHLDFLTSEEKEVFKTAYEINQKTLVQQAAQRQKYICQSQSLNLFFPFDCKPKYFNDVHLLAWELGVKTLYYCKSTSGIDIKHDDDCRSCEG